MSAFPKIALPQGTVGGLMVKLRCSVRAMADNANMLDDILTVRGLLMEQALNRLITKVDRYTPPNHTYV